MSRNILVTGGAGYLGSTMVPELLNAGHKVTVLDNFMFGQNSLAHVCHHPNFNVVRGDIRVETTMRPLMGRTPMRSSSRWRRWSARRCATRTRWARPRPTTTPS
jgi:UDP-glucose 4-epimerase